MPGLPLDAGTGGATAQLRENEKFLRQIFDGIADGLCVRSLDFMVLRVNHFMERIYAADMPLVGKRCYEVFHRRTNVCPWCPCQEAIATGEPRLAVVPLMVDGKAAGWIELSAYPMIEEGGTVSGVIEHVKDITGRVNAEAMLRASEEKYRSLFNNPMVGLFRSSIEDGLILEANNRFAEMFGYAGREEVVGKIHTGSAYEDSSARERLLRTLAKYGEVSNCEDRMYRKDGSVIWTRGALRIRPKDGYIEGVALDVTAQKRAEEALNLTQYAVEHAADAAYWVNSEGRLTYVNEATSRMLGYSREELLTMSIWDITPSVTRESWSEAWNGGTRSKTISVRTRQRRKDGKLLEVEISSGYVTFEGKEYCCGFARDLTERMALEEQLRQAQKMEAVGRLAGGVAHDFNNILQGILSAAELCIAGTGEAGSNRENLEDIRAGAQRAAGLTRQLLAFSRQQMLSPRDISLNEVIEETSNILRRAIPEAIALDIVLGKDAWAVHADPTQMQQVLVNLCLNAREALGAGGRLAVRTDNVEIDGDFCRLHAWAKPGRYVRMTVGDNGAGMDEETVGHLFEPFFTTKPHGKGTGLGLATVYGIVRQHEGMVTVSSEIGRGTTVEVYLPAAARKTDEAEAVRKDGARDGNETILVAEDEEILRDFARELLERHGYKVLAAADGEEAVEIFRREKGAVDMAFLDLVMPKLGGYEAYLKMRGMRGDLKALFVSGYGANLPAGEERPPVVAKPYDVDDLLRKIRETFDTGK